MQPRAHRTHTHMYTHTHVRAHTLTRGPQQVLGFAIFMKLFKPNMARNPFWSILTGMGTRLSAPHKRTRLESRPQAPIAQIGDAETQNGLLSPRLPLPSSLGFDVISGVLAATLEHEAAVATASQKGSRTRQVHTELCAKSSSSHPPRHLSPAHPNTCTTHMPRA